MGPTWSSLWNYTFVVQSLLLNLILIAIFESEDDSDLFARFTGNSGWTSISGSDEDLVKVGLLKFFAVVNAITAAIRVLMRIKFKTISALWADRLPRRATEVNSVLRGMANTPRLGYEILYFVWSTIAIFLNLLIPFLLVEVAIGSFSMQLVGKAVWNDKVRLTLFVAG